MGFYDRPHTEEEFARNFEQLKPLMNKTEAACESSRCLFCYDAPCVKACPTGIDIPLFIKQIQTGNLEGAARTIYDANWLGNACGAACPTDVLCEGACVYAGQDVPVIQIGRLQNFATRSAIDTNKKLFSPASDNGKKVAVIGAGPAGISAACELRLLGFAVDIFEAKGKPSGLTLHGVAPYKISNREVLDEMDFLRAQFDLKINYNSAIITSQQIEELESNYDAIFLGIGLGATREVNIPGEEKENVIGAVEFIEDLRMRQHEVKIPARVLVIGGGNTAMDAASESARLGAEEVILAYRRSREEMPAYGFEHELATAAGVKSFFSLSPVEVLGDQKVEGVKFLKTHMLNGQLETIPDQEVVLPCDLLIKATGQSKQLAFLQLIKGLELDSKGRIVINEANYQCGNPKYFAGGDAVNGGAELVNGAYDGKAAARRIWEMSEVRNEIPGPGQK